MLNNKRAPGLALRPAPLSRQRARVLMFVASQAAFPSARQIADHMGWTNVTGVSDVLNTLLGCGYLERERSDAPRKPWVWQVTKSGRKAAREATEMLAA